MTKPILGVIGGLGPIATAHFMELTIQMTDARVDQDNLDMIIYNFPSTPDRTAYILGNSPHSPLPKMLSSGRAMVQQGASCIAIPCVTAHYFHEKLENEIPVPVINGVAETAEYLRQRGITHAGIMATDGTIQAGILSRAMEAAGITPLIPSAARQRDVMHLIYDNVKAGVPAEIDRFRAVQADLQNQGAQVIILGCTELSLIKRDYPIGPGFIDVMEVLAQQSVVRCGGKLKDTYRELITK